MKKYLSNYLDMTLLTSFLWKITLVLILTFILNWTLYATLYNFDFKKTLDVMLMKRELMYASMAILISFFIAIKLLVTNFVLSTLVYSSVLSIIAVLNYFKVLILELPVFPTDIKMLKNTKELTGMISFKYLVIILILFIVIIALISTVVYIQLKRKKKEPVSKWKYTKIGLKVLCSFTVMVSIRYVYDLKNSSRTLTKYVRANGMQTIFWNQLQHYQANGPVIGYFSNFKGEIMTAPEGYSQAALLEIEEKYETRASEINATRTFDSFKDINVIYILSESLSNPERINGVNLSENPIPFITSGEGMSRWGTFLSPAYGGSTANVEFEILTSMLTNLFEPSMRLPYQDFVSAYDHFDSIVDAFDTSHAIHSYNAKFYKREAVFRSFGFSTQTFEPNMIETDRIKEGAFILDKSSYHQVLQQINSSTSPGFYHLITMQNHGGYSDIYPEYHFSVDDHELMDELTAATIKFYTQGISITDSATQAFIQSIDMIPEKTIVFFYGDHAPGIYQNFKEINDNANFYETDYFMYANFETDLSLESSISTLGVNAAIHELADVKVNNFTALLTDLSSEIITIRGENYVLTNGDILNFDELSDHAKTLVSDYQMMVYSKIKNKR